jgi:hypothetical protein
MSLGGVESMTVSPDAASPEVASSEGTAEVAAAVVGSGSDAVAGPADVGSGPEAALESEAVELVVGSEVGAVAAEVADAGVDVDVDALSVGPPAAV